MAIEFNCPYCTASIRVPDEFSGKRGSCPKCATKLIVPDVVPHSPDHGAEPSHTARTEAAAPLDASVELSPGIQRQEPAFVAPQTSSVSGKLRRKSRRRKSQGIYGVLVPVSCFLLFFGAVSAFVFLRQPELKGVLRGAPDGEQELVSPAVSIGSLNLSDDEMTQAAQAFEGAAETFVSPQITCSVTLNGDELTCSVRPGNDFQWYAVNPSGNVVLMDWLRSHKASINAHRLATLAEVGAALCRDKILRQEGTQVVFDAERYRNLFGLASQVDAFGYIVEAVVNNRRSPCVHEDVNGTVYFALPIGTSSFVIRGREINGKKLFPGEYTVQVEGASVVQPEPTTPAVPQPEADAADGESQNDEWDPLQKKNDSMQPDSDQKSMNSEPNDKITMP